MYVSKFACVCVCVCVCVRVCVFIDIYVYSYICKFTHTRTLINMKIYTAEDNDARRGSTLTTPA